MKKTGYTLALIILLISSCRKDNSDEPQDPGNQLPAMLYTDLHNRELKFQQSQSIDLDQDGTIDIAFSTWYIGDPVEKEDEVLFFASSYVHSNLLVNDNNGSPAFNPGDIIPVNNYPGYHWYQVSQVEMALKNTPVSGPPYWEGNWKQVSHKYLAIQIVKENKRYNGWIEVSFDTADEKMVLHKSAVSKESEKAVSAGK